jgi:hypothetical protein
VVGYGASTVGGAGGQTYNISTVSAFKSAVAASGARIVIMAPGVYDLDGGVTITQPNLTVVGQGAVTKRGSILVKTSEVIIRDVKSRTGDESPVAANDVDAITLNGNSAPISHILLDHVEMIWGPDVSGTILGRVTDVTVQCSIAGEGLLRSAHSESRDADGHSLAYNIVSEDASAVPERITLYGDLFTTSQARQPRVIGAKATDILDSVFYNYAAPPQGNPQSLNLIGDTWKKGPAPAAAGLPFRAMLWLFQRGGHGAFDTRLDARVFIGPKQVLGFTAGTPSGDDAAVLRSMPLMAPSAISIGPVPAYAMVIAYAGAITADATTYRLRANVLNDTGVFYSGAGYTPPNPTWP